MKYNSVYRAIQIAYRAADDLVQIAWVIIKGPTVGFDAAGLLNG